MPTGERKHRILVVEDGAIISMLLEDMVLDCGGEIVGPIPKFDAALALAAEAEFEIAVLDINLSGTLRARLRMATGEQCGGA
jgi:CheY-like chemotaxis protein